MGVLKFIIKLVWELPSNVVACVLLFYLGVDKLHWDKRGIVIADMSPKGAMTMGCFIFCNVKSRDLLEHEYGHIRQGWVLGPLYLIVIGIPSLIWVKLYHVLKKPHDSFYTERWLMKESEKEDNSSSTTLPIILILSCLLFSSCKTRTKVEYRDRIVDNYITKIVHDTLRVEVKDSTYHSVIQKGDTIYDTKYIERTKWRDRIVERYDTCWRDSIVTEYKETIKEVTKIPKIYKYAMVFSIICLIFVGIKIYLKFK